MSAVGSVTRDDPIWAYTGLHLQTKEEREAAAEAARKEREAAEAKAKAKEDKEKAMKEFAATMAKVRCACNRVVSHLESTSALGHPAEVSAHRGLGSCAIFSALHTCSIDRSTAF
jgi:hypothetical protein